MALSKAFHLYGWVVSNIDDFNSSVSEELCLDFIQNMS